MHLLEAKFQKGAKDKGRKIWKSQSIFWGKARYLQSHFKIFCRDMCLQSISRVSINLIYVEDCKIVSCHIFHFEEMSQNELESI